MISIFSEILIGSFGPIVQDRVNNWGQSDQILIFIGSRWCVHSESPGERVDLYSFGLHRRDGLSFQKRKWGLDRQEQQTSIKPFSFMLPHVKATTLVKIISVVSTRFSPFTVSHLESDLLTTMPLSSRTWLPFLHLYGMFSGNSFLWHSTCLQITCSPMSMEPDSNPLTFQGHLPPWCIAFLLFLPLT